MGLKPPDAKIKVAALPTTIDKSALVSSSLIMAGGDKKKNKKKRNKNKSSMIE